MTNKPKQYCITCRQSIPYVWEDKEYTNLEAGCEIFISGDYGSAFDMDIHKACICDKCIKLLLEEGIIKYHKTLEFKTEETI